MARQSVGYQAPVAYAIAEGATTPNPGLPGVQVWSTTTNSLMVWGGATWNAIGGGGGGTPAGNTGEVQFNNAGAFAGAANVEIQGGDLSLVDNFTPALPTPGSVKLFSKSQGGRSMLAIVGATGLDTVLQPHMAKNGWAQWKPAGNSTTISVIGGAALTATGTATSKNYAITSLYTRSSGVEYLVTTAATTAVAGFRAATGNMIYRVTDGFMHIFRVGPATGGTLASRRVFCGMSTSTAVPTDVDPATLTNTCGVGYSSADINWQIYFNGTATSKVNTGIAKPSTDRDGPFTVIVRAPPGGGSLCVRITNEVTGESFEATSTTSTNLIAATSACGPRGYASVGGVSSIVGFCLFSGYMETDN